MTRSHRPATKMNNSGFTLIEIAMVMLIIVLLMAGLLPTITSQIDLQRTTETRKQLDEIKQALMGYALINGRLPCPAKATLNSGVDALAGIEAVTGNTCACAATGDARADTSAIACDEPNVIGVLPWATLGIKETDAWERRFTYSVTAGFADSIDGTAEPLPCTIAVGVSFQLCPTGTGNLDIKPDNLSASFVATDIPVVVISHGKNGLGAYTKQGAQLALGGNEDEKENSDGAADRVYVSQPETSGFDDLATWITPNILYNRMVTAGKLP